MEHMGKYEVSTVIKTSKYDLALQITMFLTEKNTLGNHHTQQPATTNSHDTKMSSPAASNPAAIYESDTPPQAP